jgi:outer membrane autotransporter protein
MRKGKSAESRHAETGFVLSAAAALLFGAFAPAAGAETLAEGLLSRYPVPDISAPSLSDAETRTVVSKPIDRSTLYEGNTTVSFKPGVGGSATLNNSGFYAEDGSVVEIDASGYLLRVEGTVSKYLVSDGKDAVLTIQAGDFEAEVPDAGAFLSAAGTVNLLADNNIYVNAENTLSLLDITGGTVHLAAGGDIRLNGNEVAVTNQIRRYGVLEIEAGGNIWINNPDPFWGESSVQVSMGSRISVEAEGDVFLTGDFSMPQSWVLCAAGAHSLSVSGDSVYILRNSAGARDTAGEAVWTYDSDVTVGAKKLIYIAGGIDNTDSEVHINPDGKAAVAMQGDIMFTDYRTGKQGTTAVNFGSKGVFIGAVVPFSNSVFDESLAGRADLAFGSGSVWQVTGDSRVRTLSLDHAVLDLGAAKYTGVVTDTLVADKARMLVTFDTRDLGKVDYLFATKSASGTLALQVYSSGIGDGTDSGPVVIVPAGSPLKVTLSGGHKDPNGVVEVDVGDYLYTVKTVTAGDHTYTYFTHVLEDRLPDSDEEDPDESDSDEAPAPDAGAGGSHAPAAPKPEDSAKPETGGDSDSGKPETGGDADSGKPETGGDSDSGKPEEDGENKDEGTGDSGSSALPSAPVIGAPVPSAPHPGAGYALSPSAFAMVSLANPSLMTAFFASDSEDLRSRLGEIRGNGEAGVYAAAAGSESHLKNIVGSSTRTRSSGGRIGLDAKAAPQLYLGAGVKISDLSQKASYRGRTARASGNAENFQFYGAWVHPNGWYAEGVTSLLRYESTVKTAMLDGTPVRGTAVHYGFGTSAEGGRKIAVLGASGFFIEPQVQLSYLLLNGRSFTATNGMQVRQKAAESLTGRAGVVFGKDASFGASSLQWSLKGGVKHEFLHPAALRVNASEFSELSLGTRLYGGASVEYRKGCAAFYLTAQREAGHRYREDWRAAAGVRVSF